MITLIATRPSIIGFGLCGIRDMCEVTEKTDEAALAKLIEEAENDLVMIDADLYEKVRRRLKSDKTIIQIPSKSEEKEDDLDELVRDTIGVSIKT